MAFFFIYIKKTQLLHYIMVEFVIYKNLHVESLGFHF